MITLSADKALTVDWDALPVRDSVRPPLFGNKGGGEDGRLRALRGAPAVEVCKDVAEIRAAMVAQGVGVSRLAKWMGVSRHYVSSIVNGHKTPTPARIQQMRDELGI